MKKVIMFSPLFFALVIAVTILSCNNDDESQNCKMGDFTFKLNGDEWSGETFINTLVLATDPQTGIETLRCDIRATNADGNQIILTFNNPNATNDNCVDTGDYIPIDNVSSSNDNAFFFTYLQSGTNVLFTTNDGTLNIADCSINNSREISGTFTFNDIFEEYEGTEGQFTVCISN